MPSTWPQSWLDVLGRVVVGPVTVSTMPASTPVAPASGNFWQDLQPVTLGWLTGKTNVLKTGSLVTTAVTADQVILTYTVTAGKTFYLQYLSLMARLTTFATTATFFGACSLESPGGTKLITVDAAGAGIVAPPIGFIWAEPVPIAAGVVIRAVCTPSAATSFTWKASLGGYEK